MIVLHLSRQGYGIGFDLPTTPAEADKALSTPTEGMDGVVPAEISKH